MPGVDDATALAEASKAADAVLSNKTRADGADAGAAKCSQKVTVTIKAGPVACPGHRHEITAIGSPSGGTYAWTVSGAELSSKSGDTTSLRSFKPDESGNIPQRAASVAVTYTHPDGTAQDSKLIKIHKMEFQVADATVAAGELEAKEDYSTVQIQNKDPNVPTINIDAKVTIRVDASCPRKQECAGNHRAGWIQDVTASKKSVEWKHRIITAEFPQSLPLRDAAGADFPFYSDAIPFHLELEGTSDTVTVNHSDSPEWGGLWEDPKPVGTTVDNSLQQVTFQQDFSAWLVVQNVEWGTDDFVFLKHFDWSVNHVVHVDTTGRVGSRCTPRYSSPEVGPVRGGKGGSPSLTEKNITELTKMTSTPIGPPPPPTPKRRR